MNFKNPITIIIVIFLFVFYNKSIYSHEIFIYRPYLDKKPLFRENKITIHGEFFGQLQLPSTFPSYNDLRGPDDRWNYGFQNIIFLTENTALLAQLITHDDGHKRTKFDWHFSLRHSLLENLILIIGHDSNHDSDYQSTLMGKPYYVNRNYIGFGLPFKVGSFYIEPFTWFFHHSNQRGHLDFSGDKLCQEYGIRVGLWLKERVGFNFQIFSQTEAYFSLGQAFLADLIIRIKLIDFFELSLGTTLWKDIQKSQLGNKKKFYKFTWGIAIPF